MDWLAKFEHCHSLLDDDDDLWLDFSPSDPATDADLQSVSVELPDSYLKYLRISNGGEIAQCRFCGTDNLASAIEMYADLQDPDSLTPFGWGAGGAPFYFGPDGAVFLAATKISREVPERLSDSFDEFFGDVMMGAKHPLIYGDSFDDDDEWFGTLKKLGWA